jgi:hypothetical protein
VRASYTEGGLVVLGARHNQVVYIVLAFNSADELTDAAVPGGGGDAVCEHTVC